VRGFSRKTNFPHGFKENYPREREGENIGLSTVAGGFQDFVAFAV
jgi:hypothetical protein